MPRTISKNVNDLCGEYSYSLETHLEQAQEAVTKAASHLEEMTDIEAKALKAKTDASAANSAIGTNATETAAVATKASELVTAQGYATSFIRVWDLSVADLGELTTATSPTAGKYTVAKVGTDLVYKLWPVTGSAAATGSVAGSFAISSGDATAALSLRKNEEDRSEIYLDLQYYTEVSDDLDAINAFIATAVVAKATADAALVDRDAEIAAAGTLVTVTAATHTAATAAKTAASTALDDATKKRNRLRKEIDVLAQSMTITLPSITETVAYWQLDQARFEAIAATGSTGVDGSYYTLAFDDDFHEVQMVKVTVANEVATIPATPVATSFADPKIFDMDQAIALLSDSTAVWPVPATPADDS